MLYMCIIALSMCIYNILIIYIEFISIIHPLLLVLTVIYTSYIRPYPYIQTRADQHRRAGDRRGGRRDDQDD